MSIMNISQIMDRSIIILKKHLGQIALFSLIYTMLSSMLCSVLFFLGIFLSIPSLVFDYNRIIALILIIFISILAIGIFYSSSIGIIQISSQEFLEKKVGFEVLVWNSFKSSPKAIAIVILNFLLFLPIIMLFIMGGYFLYNNLEISSFIIEHEVLFFIILITIMMLVTIIISLFTSFSTFFLCAITIEKRGVIASIKDSYSLMKKYIWKVIGSMLAFELTTYAFTVSLQSFLALLIGILYIIMEILNFTEYSLIIINVVVLLFRWPLMILFWLIISPLKKIMIALLYYNQRFKNEGYDMELRLMEMEKKKARN